MRAVNAGGPGPGGSLGVGRAPEPGRSRHEPRRVAWPDWPHRHRGGPGGPRDAGELPRPHRRRGAHDGRRRRRRVDRSRTLRRSAGPRRSGPDHPTSLGPPLRHAAGHAARRRRPGHPAGGHAARHLAARHPGPHHHDHDHHGTPHRARGDHHRDHDRRPVACRPGLGRLWIGLRSARTPVGLAGCGARRSWLGEYRLAARSPCEPDAPAPRAKTCEGPRGGPSLSECVFLFPESGSRSCACRASRREVRVLGRRR